MTCPVAVFIRGVPGSGKSYLAKRLQAAIPESQVVALDPDAIDYESDTYKKHVVAATAEGVDPALFAYRFLRAQAYQGVADHKIIIWNQPFTSLEIFNKMINRLQTCASEHHTSLQLIVVEVDVSKELAAERIEKRKLAGGHGPSSGRLDRFFDDYHSFADEGYEVIPVDGAADLEEPVRQIVKTIKERARS